MPGLSNCASKHLLDVLDKAMQNGFAQFLHKYIDVYLN